MTIISIIISIIIIFIAYQANKKSVGVNIERKATCNRLKQRFVW